MHSLITKIRELPQYQKLLIEAPGNSELTGLGLPRAARLPVLAALRADISEPILLITDRADHALSLHDELGFWVSSPRFLLGEPSPLFYEQAAWGATTRRERLQTLTALAAYNLPDQGTPSAPPIIIASVRALMTRTLPRADFLNACKTCSVGQLVQPDTLSHSLVEIGYQRVNTVLDSGQFSRRGGILDVWPVAENLPVRLDFFGEEIESIRRFDPASQRTNEDLASVVLTPAREFIAQGSQETDLSEFHIPLLHSQPTTLLDYLPQKTLVLIEDSSLVDSMAMEVEEQAVKIRQESIQEGLLAPDFPLPYVPWSELLDNMSEYRIIELGSSMGDHSVDGLATAFTIGQRFAGRLKDFVEFATDLLEKKEAVIIVSRQVRRLEELWGSPGQDGGISPKNDRVPVFLEASLSEGFILGDFHLITDAEIFGWERPQPRTRQRPTAETPETFYGDLHPGDYIVHIDHGIGRFVGLVQRALDDLPHEFLVVEYEGGGQLFVPVHQVDRLTRYIGAEGVEPALDRLGGQEWQDKKSRVKEAVLEVAQDMLDLYARRQVVYGYAFKADTSWQKELEDSFPYIETDDQTKAIAAIKRDMESARPMDRLLCGDVGYGKTEVALRAAFKAVMDGKQVAILVPTTILAQQHYETFLQRLAAFPVKVEMLSRFRSPREQTEILLRLALGEIDIVIGTHRLISSDVQFKELGLVIIDEEQRFGVTHKERLKKLRTEVDVLTLTATPIPRTLYMALTGVRDISNLNTPPEERLPIVTHVGPYSPRLVRQAILREMERGGQIFFVHNRVHTILAMRAHLNQLVPEARVEVGHGQMPEHELADVMHRFYAGDTDILLSTTIIESGLDIPNANTLIVDRADTFGLAQLYQLRGRVGRGAARAYAYFFRHRKLSPTVEGQQRLEVVAENTQLGAGYSIAMRDLEIRGAGELLGTRQHGHIAAVGFHLYTRLLADAVRQIRRNERSNQPSGQKADQGAAGPLNLQLASFNQPISMPANVDLPLAVGIPADYLPDRDLRLRLYRRIADLRDETEIEPLSSEFKDRFGPLPQMVDNLFYQMRVKLRAEKAGLASIGMESGQILLRYPRPGDDREEKRLEDIGPDVRGGKGAYWCSFGNDPRWMERLLEVLDRIVQT
jgi:transcription-repair coupling factor (superfamily II helicase)